jgi:phage baseplate assembly protein gpV
MYDVITGLKIDLEMMKTRFGQMIRIGPIEVIDPVKGYRIKLADGEDGPFLSPWLPHPESGGQTSSWVPLSKGQVVGILSPNGDLRQGVLLRSGFTDDNQPPSADLVANVFKAFGITVTMKDGKTTFECDVTIKGNVEIEGNVDFRTGYVHHNDTNTGDDHVHGGVVKGAANTLGPH